MKILLAIDGSEYSDEAAKFLTRFRFSPSDEINILHVISWVPIMREWESLFEDFEKIRDEIVPKILDSASSILKITGAKIDKSFTEGFADKAIVETANETDADLIVMGARGLKGIKTHIIGSVTKLVALNSTRPVLIVNHASEETHGPLKVLFPTDGSDHSKIIGNFLSSLPLPDDTELTILNVIFSALSDIPERFSMEMDSRIKEIVASTREYEVKETEKILEEAHELLQKKFHKIDKTVKFGDPSVEILNAAEKIQADIITVGTHGMRGLKGIIGSVSRYILTHSRCSVLIGRS
jgi:nucleotide-binding universal stress UspA family protein